MSGVTIRFVPNAYTDDALPGDAQWLSSGGEGVTVEATGDPAPLRENAALAYRCPACNDKRCVPVRPWADGSPSWEWDGNIECPTLTPSILHRDCACKWHGFLTAGVFVSC